MFYYELALLKSPLPTFTFCSKVEIKIGYEVEILLKNRKKNTFAVVLNEVSKPDFECSEIISVSSKIYSKMMIEIASFVSKYYVCSYGEALSVFIPFNDEITEEEQNILFESNIKLSYEQEKAYAFCMKNKSTLLFANTGSGKTEIYIKIIEEHLNKSKQAVLLMPEISLSPQMQKRLEKVFKGQVAVWHSKITKKRKEKIIEGILKGDIKLIAGARSALFLPYKNLACIIVDEEHDESYKSDSKPRYQMKDLALYIAKKYDIQLVLGSATPSSSSFINVPYFRLTQTFYETKKEFLFDESQSTISESIYNQINQTIMKNEQVIVFLPTRANFKYQICTSCGKSVECPFCSVSMSLHKNALALKCHYCGYAQKIPNTCPSCQTGIIHNLRVGTAEVEEQLKNLFPLRIVKRFDRDIITTDKKLRELLEDFNGNKIDILVGTQMLSKGHDYHNVTLAVILGIDSVLNMNSYKSRERALSLLTQISGRSGRKGEGKVLIQTQNRDFFEHYINDYEMFLKEELSFREDFYPPYMRMAKIIFAHQNGLKAKLEMETYVKRLKEYHKDVEIVGFNECAIFKMANKYRYEILLRCKKVKPLLTALYSIDSAMATVDMDNVH